MMTEMPNKLVPQNVQRGTDPVEKDIRKKSAIGWAIIGFFACIIGSFSFWAVVVCITLTTLLVVGSYKGWIIPAPPQLPTQQEYVNMALYGTKTTNSLYRYESLHGGWR